MKQVIKFEDDKEIEVKYDEEGFEVVCTLEATNKYPGLYNKQLQEVLKQYPDDAVIFIGSKDTYSLLNYGEMSAGINNTVFPGVFKDDLYKEANTVKILTLLPANVKPQFYDIDEEE